MRQTSLINEVVIRQAPGQLIYFGRRRNRRRAVGRNTPHHCAEPTHKQQIDLQKFVSLAIFENAS